MAVSESGTRAVGAAECEQSDRPGEGGSHLCRVSLPGTPQRAVGSRLLGATTRLIRWFGSLTRDDIPLVGGKNASFGEMIRELTPLGVRVPDGFALTADAYRAVLDGPGIRETMRKSLAQLDPTDVDSLRACGATIRRAIRRAPFPGDL